MIVLWSGGCDSTLVLYDQLERAKSMGDVRTCRAVSITHFAVAAKVEQRNARARIRAKLKKMGYEFDHQEVDISLSGKHEISLGSVVAGGLSQPQIWIPNATMWLDEDEDLATGHIAGDCLWHHRSDVLATFNGIQAISQRRGKLVFPLEWEEKYQVIRRLKILGLYDLCWWCETSGPLGVAALRHPCGKCSPCMTHATALHRLKIEDDRNGGDVGEKHSKKLISM